MAKSRWDNSCMPHWDGKWPKNKNKAQALLLSNIKRDISLLKQELKIIQDDWCEEDYVYRFYHQSFKLYSIQSATKRIVQVLSRLDPKIKPSFDKIFQKIIKDGTKGEWQQHHNSKWNKHTRPQLEAFWHCKYFLERAIKYGSSLNVPPNPMQSGWAALTELYNIRYDIEDSCLTLNNDSDKVINNETKKYKTKRPTSKSR